MDSVNSEYGLMRDMLKINFKWGIRMFGFSFEIVFDLLIHLYFSRICPSGDFTNLVYSSLSLIQNGWYSSQSQQTLSVDLVASHNAQRDTLKIQIWGNVITLDLFF